MPLVGFGTFLSKPGEIQPALKAAIEGGYRHIDCAAVYRNEAEIGQTLQELFTAGVVKREDLFITSKLANSQMHPDEVLPALKKTLSDLQLTYLDLYLVHLPVAAVVPAEGTPSVRRLPGFGLQDTWRQFEKAYEQGLVKAIGVSNFNIQTLNDCLNYAKIAPAVNQVERHPYLVQPKLVKFCKDYHVAITAYASLGAPGLQRGISVPLLEDATIAEIAKKHNKKPSQVLLRWSLEENVIVIPKSVTVERIHENFNILDFTLTPEEVEKISSLDQNLRSFTQEWFGCPIFA